MATLESGFKGEVGDPEVFESATVTFASVTMLSDVKALVTYTDTGNSSYITACVLSVSGETITAGTPLQVAAEVAQYTAVDKLSETTAVLVYRHTAAGVGRTSVLSVSGTTVTAGGIETFASTNTSWQSVTALSATKAVVTYRGTSSYGRACVLSITGTSVAAGTPATFESADASYTSVDTLSETKAIVAYADDGNGHYGTACVLDISGTTVTPGTPAIFDSVACKGVGLTVLSDTIVVTTYRDDVTGYGVACVLSISTSTITPGTPATFENSSTNDTSVTTLSATKALTVYKNNGNGSFGTSCLLNISGTTVTGDDPFVFEGTSSSYPSVSALSGSKAITTFNGGASSYGTARILY